MDVNGDLYSYLRGARETLVWKLEGLAEYDKRRPMTPTGTNLLGLVKHSARSHLLYFCDVFDRPQDESLRWLSDVTPGSDMWAKHDESADGIVSAYRRSWELADETASELPIDACGRVPWWGDDPVTLERVVVHLTAETQRHAGHSFQDPCLAYEQRSSGSGDGDSSESGPPCVSEVGWAAVWGRADYDFVAHACASGAAVATGPEGEYVIVVPADSTPTEPAFLLPDGRAVQGPAWSAPLDELDAASCREAASVTATPPSPIELTVEVANPGVVASPTISVSTDTGFLALYESQAFAGLEDDGERVAVFPDTTQVVIQGLGDTHSNVESEVVVPIADIVERVASGSGCTSIVIELDSATVGRATEAC